MTRFGGGYPARFLAAALFFATCVGAADPPVGDATHPWLTPYDRPTRFLKIVDTRRLTTYSRADYTPTPTCPIAHFSHGVPRK
jgi:hypothetical protein